MPPASDDASISGDSVVLRVLHPKWVTTKGGRERPTSDSLLDSNYENSCFLEGEISLAELQVLFIGRKIARIPVSLLRAEGFWLERRPGEAPDGCTRPSSHLVCGPPDAPVRGIYEAKARRIVRALGIEILPGLPRPDPEVLEQANPNQE
jgi:hypothetical protein